LVILILLSGFFSASEAALSAYRSNYLEKLDEEKHPKKYAVMKKWLKDPNAMLTGIVIGNNVVNILASSIATIVIVNYFGNKGSSVALATAIMTILILIFGEISPKLMARNNSAKIAEAVSVIIYVLSIILTPVVYCLIFISRFVGRILGVNMTSPQLMITEEDIISFVNVGNAEGIIEEDEKEMIHSIVTLGETSAKEVMTPRTSMLAFEGAKTINEVWDEIVDNGFSRIPIYEETIDNIIGILYVKDLMEHIKNNELDIPIKQFIRSAYFVPETKNVNELFNEMQSEKKHIAILIDEYGGFSGIVTLEDLIEEVMGNISDEFDADDSSIKKLSANKYLINGELSLNDLNDYFHIELESKHYDTLSGLLIEHMGYIPEDNEDIEPIIIDEISFKPKRVKDKKIEWVLAKFNKEEKLN